MPPKRDSVTGVTAKNGFIVWWTHFFFVSSQHEKVHVIVDGCRGIRCVFRIKPESGLEWSVVNGTEWFKNWQNDNGVYTLRVMPRKAGMMMLCVRMTEKPPKFISCLMYDVVK